MPSETILFVEDNKDLRENAALVLQLEGYIVHLARDGREALDMLGDGLVPHLIVSDIMMPRMDGYEFFKAVQGMSHLRAIPFIFLTARGSRQDVSLGRVLGVDDYLIKPFEPEEFLITVQNKLRRTDEMRAHAAKSLDDARRILIQLLSHELRTPLTYVTGGFALLADELEEQLPTNNGNDVYVSLDLIQSGTERLNRLAEQMVLYSEIISGYVERQVEEIGEHLNFEYLLHDARSLLNNLAAERGITFVCTGSEQVAGEVRGVHNLLMTALSEIIRNAIMFSPEGAQVELEVTCTDETITLTVTDQGIGIRPEDIENIWKVLIQSGRDRTEQQGAGMGLPIVKGIVTAHGGDVELDSVLGEGTQVRLTLPLAHTPADED